MRTVMMAQNLQSKGETPSPEAVIIAPSSRSLPATNKEALPSPGWLVYECLHIDSTLYEMKRSLTHRSDFAKACERCRRRRRPG